MNIIIPSRYASSRLPAKPLADIGGKPMIVRVYEQAVECAGQGNVFVACDDPRIETVVQAVGGLTVMTKESHISGTDRLAEAAAKIGLEDDAVIINVQGDEPFIPVDLIKQTYELLQSHPQAAMSTCVTPINNPDDILDPNVVKAVMDDTGRALYFSRAPIPYDRDGVGAKNIPYYRHVGIYGYRYHALKQITQASENPLEKLEKLEQLRALGLGLTIQVGVYKGAVPHGVDTAADLERAIDYLKQHHAHHQQGPS